MGFIKIRRMVIVIVLMMLVTGCQADDDSNLGENSNSSSVNNESENKHNNLVNNESNAEDTSNHSNNEDNVEADGNNSNNNENDSIITDEMMNDPSIIALVNKQYHLTMDDVPEDLVTVDVPTILDNPEVNQLRKIAADALKEMFDEAKNEDIYLYARSGYRSFETQTSLFQSYVDRNGEEAANRYSARPGQSEHQTGLVMDVTSESVDYQLTESFGETVEGKWLSEHAHEFGFIIRYPKNKEHITGYIYEPWHIRYLGVEMATNVFHSELTYEELLEKEGIVDVVTQ